MRRVSLSILASLPTAALAEVADKVPSSLGLVGLAVIVAVVTLFAASRDWRLCLIGVAFVAFELWWFFFDLADIRADVLRENGEIYVLAFVASIAIVATATVTGGIRGWRKRDG